MTLTETQRAIKAALQQGIDENRIITLQDALQIVVEIAEQEDDSTRDCCRSMSEDASHE